MRCPESLGFFADLDRIARQTTPRYVAICETSGATCLYSDCLADLRISAILSRNSGHRTRLLLCDTWTNQIVN